MSRCFPFPPPGYEKKPIPQVANVLKKEKTKEKKHKDKKDKDKRDSKDKRDKEKSEKKHREKKDKKEKNKDKKDKEKNKEKDHEKGSTSAEKRDFGQSEDYHGTKSHQSEKERGKEKKESSSTSEDKRQIGQFDYCNGEKLHQKVEKSRDKRNPSDEKKLAVQIQGHTGGYKPVQHIFANNDSQNPKFLLEFSKRIDDGGKGSGSQLAEGYMGMGFKKDERSDRFAVRDTCLIVEGKDKIKDKLEDKQVNNCKIGGQRIHHEEKFNGNTMSQNLTGISKSTDKFEGRMEGKEKLKEREDDKVGDKRNSKHKDKQSQRTDKNSEKGKRKEDKAKKEHKKPEKDNRGNSNKNDTGGTLNNKTSHLSKDIDKNAATEGNLKKRKDIEKNGYLHEDVIRPEKMARLNSLPLSENGLELEPSQTTTPFSPQEQRADNYFEVYNKDTMKNGLTGPHQLPIYAAQPSPVIAEPSRKSPHPDMKYLSKVLLVPQVHEWSDVDDQTWLFNNKNSLLSKCEVDPVGVDQGQQVWAEALRIESADVIALPYVIPY